MRPLHILRHFAAIACAAIGFGLAVSAASPQAPPPAPIPPGDWIQLFNGRNLDGWVPKIAGFDLGVNYNDTFRVEDGLLRVSYDKYKTFDNRFGHLFYR